MKREIWLPCEGLQNNDRFKQIIDLLFVHPDDMSVREKAVIDFAQEHGLIYHGWMEEFETAYEIITDMGSPESIVSAKFPLSVDKTLAAGALQKIVEILMEVDE